MVNKTANMYRKFANDADKSAAKWEELAKKFKANGQRNIAITAARQARSNRASARRWRDMADSE